jgi:hypothetical protein
MASCTRGWVRVGHTGPPRLRIRPQSAHPPKPPYPNGLTPPSLRTYISPTPPHLSTGQAVGGGDKVLHVHVYASCACVMCMCHVHVSCACVCVCACACVMCMCMCMRHVHVHEPCACVMLDLSLEGCLAPGAPQAATERSVAVPVTVLLSLLLSAKESAITACSNTATAQSHRAQGVQRYDRTEFHPTYTVRTRIHTLAKKTLTDNNANKQQATTPTSNKHKTRQSTQAHNSLQQHTTASLTYQH